MKSLWKSLPEVVSYSQKLSLADRKIQLQLDNPSELELLNNGQVKIIILGIYSRFLQAYSFLFISKLKRLTNVCKTLSNNFQISYYLNVDETFHIRL